jgi:spermidine synthase
LVHTSAYQRIVVTRNGATVNLFIDGALQFSSIDEYRYHESLVHPAMSLSRRREHVLVLGGGLAVREILKHPQVKRITLVDLDPAITDLFSSNKLLTTLNDPRVSVINDVPDPHNLSLSKLFSRSFYTLLARHLHADGLMVTQATSPVFATQAYWSIANTLAAVPSPYARGYFLQVHPYHAYVPSFGEWGFVIAAPHLAAWETINISVATRFLDTAALLSMTQFARDIAAVDAQINTIHTHVLPRYYEQGWSRWYQ